MAKRFGRLKQGPLIAEMAANYRLWEDRPVSERFGGVGNGPDRSPTVFLAIDPFGIDLGGTDKYRVRSNQRNRAQLGGAVGARVSTTLTNSLRAPGFQPALVKVKIVTGKASRISEITKRKYTRQLGESYQHPFGATGTEREFEAFEAITIAISGNARFSYRPERFPLI